MERLAYIAIEPDNGGIVLNVSKGGLCFHSIAPVQPGNRIRFSASDHNRVIEADAEMVWTDANGTAGGMRFKTVPEELAEQIRRWVTITASDRPAETRVGSVPISAARNQVPSRPLGSTRKLRVRIRLSGYARGLLTGLLFSALLGFGVALRAYRSRLGETLIHVGQSLTENAQTSRPTMQAASTPKPKLVAAEETLPASPSQPTAKPIAHSESAVTSSPVDDPEPVVRIFRTSRATVGLQPKTRPDPGASLTPPAFTLPMVAEVPHLVTSTVVPTLANGNKTPLLQEESKTFQAGPPPEMFLEVGKFKQEIAAQNTRQKVAMLGLPASVVQKGRLWTNSYHILVGPYEDEFNARAASHTLVSSGYKPRPYERGSRYFTFGSKLVVDHTSMPIGDCEIKWESYVEKALVKIVQNDGLVASVSGRWERRTSKFDKNAVVYQRNPDGSRTLIEIHFSGMDRALVFQASS